MWVLHRIGASPYSSGNPNNGLFVSEERIEKLVISFRRLGYKFVSMDEFLRSAPNTKLITITLDDGYADNLTCGLPLFEALNIPVLLFVNTHYVLTNKELWWLQLGNEIFEEISDTITIDEKLKDFFQKRSCMVKNHISEYNRHDVENNIENKSNEIMSPKQLVKFSSSPLVTLGAHTHTHIAISVHNDCEIYDDVSKNIREIQHITGHRVKYFAYPYGSALEIRDCVKVLKQLEIFAAFTTNDDFLRKNYNKYFIPRVTIDDQTTFKSLIIRQIKKNLREVFYKRRCEY